MATATTLSGLFNGLKLPLGISPLVLILCNLFLLFVKKRPQLSRTLTGYSCQTTVSCGY